MEFPARGVKEQVIQGCSGANSASRGTEPGSESGGGGPRRYRGGFHHPSRYGRGVTETPAQPPAGQPAPELFTWEFATDPYPAYAWLREHAPVHRTKLPSGVEAWLVTRYADAKQALADGR
ncbi:hypothetical protein ACWD4T_20060, partial [Streptomyces umbrinus]